MPIKTVCKKYEKKISKKMTDRQKVNTEDTLSGFQEFFLQPIIKDRSDLFVCSCMVVRYRSNDVKRYILIFAVDHFNKHDMEACFIRSAAWAVMFHCIYNIPLHV